MGLPPPLAERKGKIDGLFLGLGVYARARVCLRACFFMFQFISSCMWGSLAEETQPDITALILNIYQYIFFSPLIHSPAV